MWPWYEWYSSSYSIDVVNHSEKHIGDPVASACSEYGRGEYAVLSPISGIFSVECIKIRHLLHTIDALFSIDQHLIK
jgi:hypothetical protein